MSNITIPVLTNPNYNKRITLDGNLYRYRIRWNTSTEKWYMKMVGINTDLDRTTALLCGKDLSKPWGRYELGQIWVIDNSGAEEDPDYYGFGSRWTLEYTPLADV